MEQNQNRTKSVVFLVLSVLFLAMAVGTAVLLIRPLEKEVASQTQKISGLENQITMQQRAAQSEKEAQIQQATGLNRERMDKDVPIIEDMLNTAMTWDSYESYNTQREKLIADYHLSKTSDFFQVFMPEVNDKVAPNGSHYNLIDNDGLRVRYDKLTPYCTGIKGGDYYYTVLVQWHTVNGSGNTDTAESIVTLCVDSDHGIKDIHAFA